MIGSLEGTLLAARSMPFPVAWAAAQLLAAFVALGYVGARTRSWILIRDFALALGAGGLGALALGLVFRLLDRWTGQDVDLIGVSAYGALAGTALAFARLAERRGLVWLESLDLAAPALALLVAIGRLGCFLAGCDAGHVTDSFLSVRFPAGSSTFRDHVARGFVLPTDTWSLTVHPAQLYEAGMALGLAWIGHQLGKLRIAPGHVFGVTAMGYTLLRGCADLLRLPARNALYGLLTSLLVALIVVCLLARSRALAPLRQYRQ